MKELEFTVSDIKDLMEAFHRNNLGGMEISAGDFSLKLEGVKQIQAAAPVQAVSFPPVQAPVEDLDGALPGNVVTSPIVGTFYAAPAPDKAPFVTAGTRVKKGDVLFIIESMKLMNEVTSEFDGMVSRVLLENASPVEYGQPVLTIE